MSNLVVLCTCPDQASATRLAQSIVAQRLAACVNQLDGIASTYRWQGEVTTDTETLLLIKTAAGRFKALEEFILANHPYEVPELVALEISAGSSAYLKWLAQASSSENSH